MKYWLNERIINVLHTKLILTMQIVTEMYPCIPKKKCHLITYLYLSSFHLEIIQFTFLLHSFALDDDNSSLTVWDVIYVLKKTIDDISPLNHEYELNDQAFDKIKKLISFEQNLMYTDHCFFHDLYKQQ